ncbi:hypothetical protein [Allorhodopirellula heiligendammensis]|uniref:Uncharacterized protein n=1 Tax=Allorhodopirellula heiligendammensis TaxID=2714739 RepID=A0A5C6C3K6_9BACT|nr:hypothetical protein [Allorhodopirellula heiligendammensis]TWU17874.1 hypothetical protein Poly21_00250 [Allorhodopirellula heiligendammensis]
MSRLNRGESNRESQVNLMRHQKRREGSRRSNKKSTLREQTRYLGEKSKRNQIFTTGKKRMGRLQDVGETDGWRCWLCDEPVNPNMSSNDPRGASLDGRISKGRAKKRKQDKSDLPTKRLTHKSCNTGKGANDPVVPWPDLLIVVDPAPSHKTSEQSAPHSPPPNAEQNFVALQPIAPRHPTRTESKPPPESPPTPPPAPIPNSIHQPREQLPRKAKITSPTQRQRTQPNSYESTPAVIKRRCHVCNVMSSVSHRGQIFTSYSSGTWKIRQYG